MVKRMMQSLGSRVLQSILGVLLQLPADPRQLPIGPRARWPPCWRCDYFFFEESRFLNSAGVYLPAWALIPGMHHWIPYHSEGRLTWWRWIDESSGSACLDTWGSWSSDQNKLVEVWLELESLLCRWGDCQVSPNSWSRPCGLELPGEAGWGCTSSLAAGVQQTSWGGPAWHRTVPYAVHHVGVVKDWFVYCWKLNDVKMNFRFNINPMIFRIRSAHFDVFRLNVISPLLLAPFFLQKSIVTSVTRWGDLLVFVSLWQQFNCPNLPHS